MNATYDELLKLAIAGDAKAFQKLFLEFQEQLKSYLYRLLTDFDEAEDISQESYLKAFSNLSSFQKKSSLKTWVFTIATNLAYDLLRHRKRWTVDIKSKGKELAMSNPSVWERIQTVKNTSEEEAFEIRDHINHCFTCMAKTLPIERQIAMILRDIYDFQVKDISLILQKSIDITKHLLQDARKTMTSIFDDRCALIQKQGVCNQCSELNGAFNPKQDLQIQLNQIDFVKGSKKYNREELYEMRLKLVKTINPLNGKGANLQDILMKTDRLAFGEINSF
ncbi:MAG: sigma-70 family RNA polymerase sigma factor [Leptospira sp.]|nr:sigma-70 family RNA polymerase sigma factor [Leptospira sp.]NCS92226.1 sigma-70 family RNA polymerase sigma factor [Leptospira sp.]